MQLVDLSSFVRFGLVGTVGFVVDAGVLQALVSLADWGPIEARAVSFPVAVLATWLLNRNITFRAAIDVPAHRSLARYVTVSLAGASMNFIVYTSLVFASSVMAAHPVVPLAIASGIALIVNYLGSKFFAFR